MEPVRTVEVNADGTVDPEQLAGLPAEIASQLATTDLRPYLRIRQRTGRRENRWTMRLAFDSKRGTAHNPTRALRPVEMSGRQWKRWKRLSRKIDRANMRGESQ